MVMNLYKVLDVFYKIAISPLINPKSKEYLQNIADKIEDEILKNFVKLEIFSINDQKPFFKFKNVSKIPADYFKYFLENNREKLICFQHKFPICYVKDLIKGNFSNCFYWDIYGILTGNNDGFPNAVIDEENKRIIIYLKERYFLQFVDDEDLQFETTLINNVKKDKTLNTTIYHELIHAHVYSQEKQEYELKDLTLDDVLKDIEQIEKEDHTFSTFDVLENNMYFHSKAESFTLRGEFDRFLHDNLNDIKKLKITNQNLQQIIEEYIFEFTNYNIYFDDNKLRNLYNYVKESRLENVEGKTLKDLNKRFEIYTVGELVKMAKANYRKFTNAFIEFCKTNNII